MFAWTAAIACSACSMETRPDVMIAATRGVGVIVSSG